VAKGLGIGKSRGRLCVEAPASAVFDGQGSQSSTVAPAVS
jgi:hypothetical protein